MTDAAGTEILSLSDAFARLSDQTLVDAVCKEERRFPARDLRHFYKMYGDIRLQLTPDRALRPPSPDYSLSSSEQFEFLLAAWRALERDFRNRLVRADLHLQGVQIRPTRDSARSTINGIWAAEFKFGLRDDTLTFPDHAYVAVVASRTPFPAASVPEAPVGFAPAELTIEQVAQLDPEVVAALLERHAEHVRTGLRVNLLPPGGASPIALIASMMRHRAKGSALLPKLAQEAEWLSTWSGKVAPSYSVVGAKRIQNALGPLYWDLVAARVKPTA